MDTLIGLIAGIVIGTEQEAESEAIRDRLNKANALIYTRNRTISLLAVRA